MIKASTSQIKDGFGRYLDYALTEGAVYITRFGRIIAKIEPVYKDEAEAAEKIVKDEESKARRHLQACSKG